MPASWIRRYNIIQTINIIKLIYRYNKKSNFCGKICKNIHSGTKNKSNHYIPEEE